SSLLSLLSLEPALASVAPACSRFCCSSLFSLLRSRMAGPAGIQISGKAQDRGIAHGGNRGGPQGEGAGLARVDDPPVHQGVMARKGAPRLVGLPVYVDQQ